MGIALVYLTFFFIPSHPLINGDGVIEIQTHVQTNTNTNFSAISPRE